MVLDHCQVTLANVRRRDRCSWPLSPLLPAAAAETALPFRPPLHVGDRDLYVPGGHVRLSVGRPSMVTSYTLSLSASAGFSLVGAGAALNVRSPLVASKLNLLLSAPLPTQA